MSLRLNFFSTLEAGVDEAGRGSLAGPVTAAAVILPNSFNSEILNDSKKISKDKRNQLRKIIEKEAITFSVINIESKIIDKINILNATMKAMHLAINNLKVKPKHLLVDGNFFYDFNNIPHKCIIKGDSKYQNIAAASILAKTYRDDYMLDLNKINSNYGWDKNKGYGTERHRQAIKKYGTTKFHRKSFQLLKKQLVLSL